MEIEILDAIQKLRTPLGDVLMPFFSALGNAGLIWIVVAAVFALIPRTRRLGFTLGLAMVFDLILCNIILKPVVARTRPFDVNTAVELIIARPKDYSFPSGHTAAAFAVVAALLVCKSRLWIPAGVLAVLIAFSRLYLYVHYPTDILGGILVGFVSGAAGAYGMRAFYVRWEHRVKKRE